MSWSERLTARASALCIGLDPVASRLPDGMSRLDFCLAVVEQTHEFAACFKPNIAFFEVAGAAGLAELEVVLREIAQLNVPVIMDAKRGDIGSTAALYAQAYLADGPLAADALTVNPFLGLDTIEPFAATAREHDRGLFLLLRTSNAQAALFQDKMEADLVPAIAADPALGAVVGATDAATGARLRAALPDTLFLVPGFGAQGGTDLTPFFSNGGKAVVNSSRAILYAGEGQGWPARRAAIRDAARTAHGMIERARK